MTFFFISDINHDLFWGNILVNLFPAQRRASEKVKTEDNAREEGFEDVGSSSLQLDPFSPIKRREVDEK